MPEVIPKPGSPEAISDGCTCPIEINCHGFGLLGGTVIHPDTEKPVFTFKEDCPLHGIHTNAMVEIKEQ